MCARCNRTRAWDRILIAISFIGLSCAGANAQTTTPSKATISAPKPAPASTRKPGTVSGRVFAITAGGDIKPARLARVYLIYSSIDILKAWYDGLSAARTLYLSQLKDPEGFTKAKLLEDYDEDASFLGALPPPTRDRLVALYEADLRAQILMAHEIADIKRDLVELAAKSRFEQFRWSEETTCKRDLLNYEMALAGVRKWRWDHREWDQFVAGQADEEGQFKVEVPRAGKYLLFVRGRAGFNEAFWSADVTIASGVEAVVKLGEPEKACLIMQ